MTDHEKKVELLRKYHRNIAENTGFSIKGDIPIRSVDNALKKFASGMDRTTMIGFYDTTITGSGKNGYIFTDTKVYYLETLEKPKKLWYDDIKSVEVVDKHKNKDCNRGLKFNLYDGTTITWTSCFLNKTPLYNFFVELLDMMNNPEKAEEEQIDYHNQFEAGAVAGGTAGWVGGAAIGSAILPGIGTVVGGLIGSIGAGAVANKATDTVLGNFIEDDADEMVRIIEKQFGELAVDYLLNQKEAEKVADNLQGKLDGKILKKMYASTDRKDFARDILILLIESEVSKRKKVMLPTDEQMSQGGRIVLEELVDLSEGTV